MGIDDPAQLEKAAKQVADRALSVRETEKLVKAIQSPPETIKIVHDVDHTRTLETILQKRLGRTVKISEKGKSKMVSIGYSDNQDLEILLKMLCGDSILDQL